MKRFILVGFFLVCPLFASDELGSLVVPAGKAPVDQGGDSVAVHAATLQVRQPTEWTVLQRDERGQALLRVDCINTGGAVEIRVLDRQNGQVAKDWTALAREEGSFRGSFLLRAGWYRIEVRSKRAGAVVESCEVGRVGIGEVFVTSGQSNAGNHGNPIQHARDDRVATCDYKTGLWRHADDPEPGAGGKGGSPWPMLGDLLVKKLDVPVGFICTAVGGTEVSEWVPSGQHYSRLKQALQLAGSHGVRAVLWHQGESDSIAGTSTDDYARLLEQVISQSRVDAGWPVPWGVALASYHPKRKATADRQRAVIAGQRKVTAEYPGVFQGPATDSFHERGLLADSVHFNAEGLAEHAQGWADALTVVFYRTGTARLDK
ncbi:MAG: sialate O-acetylesterase [Opitutaceae bacterium]|jgi:hypothetical protein